jgi:hypothetical protein
MTLPVAALVLALGCAKQESASTAANPPATNTGAAPTPPANQEPVSETANNEAVEVTKAALTDDPASHKPRDTYDINTPKIFVELEFKGTKGGDTIKNSFVCDHGTDSTGKEHNDYTIDSVTNTLKDGMHFAEASLTKPTKGWPIGDYHVDVYINDTLRKTLKFTVAPEVQKEP